MDSQSVKCHPSYYLLSTKGCKDTYAKKKSGRPHFNLMISSISTKDKTRCHGLPAEHSTAHKVVWPQRSNLESDWLLLIGEGSGNPLQCSCLENPRDGGAWWAAVHGVAQSGTRLKWLAAAAAAAWRFAPLNTRHWETHVLCIELAPVIFNLNLSENSQISSECVTFYKAVFLGCLKNVRVTKSNKK